MKQRFVKSFVSFAMIINLLISPLQQLDLQLINYDDVDSMQLDLHLELHLDLHLDLQFITNYDDVGSDAQ